MIPEEVRTLLDYIWAPFVGYVMLLIRGHKADNKERDKDVNKQRERIAVLEASQETVQNRFDRMESKIDKVSDQLHEVLTSLPKRSGD